MMKNKIINFLFLMFLLSGCSDITNPSNESLSVSSESTSTSLIIESNQSDVINVPPELLKHEITLINKNKSYNFEIVDGQIIINSHIAKALYEKNSCVLPRSFVLYTDSEHELKYEYLPVKGDLQLYLEFVDTTLEYESIKCYYELLEYIYDVKYSFEEYYNAYVKSIDLTDIESYYSGSFTTNNENEVCVSFKYLSEQNGLSNLYIPLVDYTFVSIDMYYGGCEYFVESYPCKKGEDFRYPSGYDLFNLETLTIYEDGIIENVTEYMYVYIYYSGLSSYHALKYIAENQLDTYFDINFNYYDIYKLGHFNLVEVDTDIYKLENPIAKATIGFEYHMLKSSYCSITLSIAQVGTFHRYLRGCRGFIVPYDSTTLNKRDMINILYNHFIVNKILAECQILLYYGTYLHSIYVIKELIWKIITT